MSWRSWDVETSDCLESPPPPCYTLSFDQQCDLRLVTYMGPLTIPRESAVGEIPAAHDCFCDPHVDNTDLGWTMTDPWLQYNGTKSISLTADHDLRVQLTRGPTSFIGNASGHVRKVSSSKDSERTSAWSLTSL